jgi:hypothetical protein
MAVKIATVASRASINSVRKYIQTSFHTANVGLGLGLCSASAVYLRLKIQTVRGHAIENQTRSSRYAVSP